MPQRRAPRKTLGVFSLTDAFFPVLTFADAKRRLESSVLDDLPRGLLAPTRSQIVVVEFADGSARVAGTRKRRRRAPVAVVADDDDAGADDAVDGNGINDDDGGDGDVNDVLPLAAAVAAVAVAPVAVAPVVATLSHAAARRIGRPRGSRNAPQAAQHVSYSRAKTSCRDFDRIVDTARALAADAARQPRSRRDVRAPVRLDT